MRRPDTKYITIWKQLLTHLTQGLVIGGVALSVMVGGNMSVALATETQHLFQIQAQTVTGTLDHIPLEAVLKDLKEQLGLEYSGPEKEMQTLVSGQFQSESLSAALSSILSAWDYALTSDQTGKPIKVFLSTKFADETIQPSKQPQTRHVRQEHSRPSSSPKNNPPGSHGLHSKHETHQQGMNTASTTSNSPGNVPHMMIQPSARKKMDVTPTASSAKMPILPAGKGKAMPPPTKSLAGMPIIPASGFSPMKISPVSPETSMDFVETRQ